MWWTPSCVRVGPTTIRLEPAVVVPSHYDDFFRPLGRPLGFAPNVSLATLQEEVGAVSRGIELAALPLLRPVGRPGTG